jgi:3,4-dihydroxy 2-butanone 4-phosphate synthase/GTP cyclohydrolase II
VDEPHQRGISGSPAPSDAPPESASDWSVATAVAAAVSDIALGRPIVLIDDAARENEGDLVFAAELATTELVAFTMTQCRGLLCVPMTGSDLDRLELPPMVAINRERHGTAFAVSVDAREAVTTGISAADRARTITLLGRHTTTPADLSRPGHVFPLRAAPGGVLERAGHTEAAIDLVRLAGLRPAAAICEIANVDGSMARLPELTAFAFTHSLRILTIADLTTFLKS